MGCDIECCICLNSLQQLDDKDLIESNSVKISGQEIERQREQLRNRVFKCNHTEFHRECIEKYVNSCIEAKCPLCRSAMVNRSRQDPFHAMEWMDVYYGVFFGCLAVCHSCLMILFVRLITQC